MSNIFEDDDAKPMFKCKKLFVCVMNDDKGTANTRAYPLKLSTDESYTKMFPEDKSTADSPFIFNMDNVQFHLEEESILLTG